AAAFQPQIDTISGANLDRPLFLIAPAEVEADIQRAVSGRTRQCYPGGDRGLRIRRILELRLAHEHGPGEDLRNYGEGVDPRIEHAEPARLEDPGLARMPFVHILVPAHRHRGDPLAGEQPRRLVDRGIVLRMPGGE